MILLIFSAVFISNILFYLYTELSIILILFGLLSSLYIIILTLVNISHFKIIASNNDITRKFILPTFFGLKVYQKKFELNNLSSIGKLNSRGNTYVLNFSNGTIDINSSISNMNEILLFIYDNKGDEIFSKDSLNHLKSLRS